MSNFVLTAHLGVDVPPNKCWLGVGDERKYWENGKVMIFDTSVLHEAANEAEKVCSVCWMCWVRSMCSVCSGDRDGHHAAITGTTPLPPPLAAHSLPLLTTVPSLTLLGPVRAYASRVAPRNYRDRARGHTVHI